MPAPGSGGSGAGPAVVAAGHNLVLRIVSAAVLAPLALAVAYAGGVGFTVFWGLAAAAVLWEWTRLVQGPLWIAAGIVYAALMVACPVVLRADAALGFAAIVFLFAIVWSTDVLGYFAGRAIGGPKLMPAVSPKKTWAGAIAGTVGAVAVTAALARWLGLDPVAIGGLALLLSVVAQSGDLLESWVKRHFGAKDASHLIPGHGGVMDRLDGFWAAALVGAAIGFARGGMDAAARGLLLW
jgi:phosphatidate cytidylyltransferase